MSTSASSSSSPSPSSTETRPTPVDRFYGYARLAGFSTYVIRSLFPPSEGARDATSTGSIRMPPLMDFIAYALCRTRLSEPIVYSALLLLTRLKELYPSARGTPSSPHRLFLSALMLASKMTMDDTFTNKSWVIVGQNIFKINELNRMERELFGFLDSNCYITKADLQAWCDEWCQEEEEDELMMDLQAEEEEAEESHSVLVVSDARETMDRSRSRSDTPTTSSSTSTSPPGTPHHQASISSSLNKILNSSTTTIKPSTHHQSQQDHQQFQVLDHISWHTPPQAL